MLIVRLQFFIQIKPEPVLEPFKDKSRMGMTCGEPARRVNPVNGGISSAISPGISLSRWGMKCRARAQCTPVFFPLWGKNQRRTVGESFSSGADYAGSNYERGVINDATRNDE